MRSRARMSASGRELEVRVCAGQGEEDAVVSVVALEAADLGEAQPVAVEPRDLVETRRVAGEPHLHGRHLGRTILKGPVNT